MKLNRNKFIASLQSVQAGLATKEIIQHSDCFTFKDGSVITFNDEVLCKAPSLLDKDFEGAIPGKKILENLNKWTEEEIEVEPSNGEIVFRGDRGRETGIRLESKTLLPISVVDAPNNWKKLHKEFSDAIEVVQQCAGSDETKFTLTCLHLHSKWIEATDKYQVCRWDMDTNIENDVLVRQSSIKHIINMDMDEFSETESWIHFKNPTNLIISCRKYSGDFPNLTKLLQVEVKELIDIPNGLMASVQAAADFSSENVDNNQVLVTMKQGKLRIRGSGVSGWYEKPEKVNYNGEPISFLIPPNLLLDIIKKHSKCYISSSTLKVDAGKYSYITCLTAPKTTENGESKQNKKISNDNKKKKKVSVVQED